MREFYLGENLFDPFIVDNPSFRQYVFKPGFSLPRPLTSRCKAPHDWERSLRRKFASEWVNAESASGIHPITTPTISSTKIFDLSQLCMWLNGRKFPANHTSSVCAFSFLANPRKLLPHLPSFPNNGHHVVDRWFILFARVCIGRVQRFGFSSTKPYYRI